MNNTQEVEDEINLIDIAKVLWKWKIMIVLLPVLFSIGAAGIGSVMHPVKYVSEVIVSLKFPGIEKHQYPDGTIFEGRQIIAPHILFEATSLLEKEGNDFLAGNLRAMIHIQPVIPPEIAGKIKKAQKNKESFEFFPNQFSLILATENKMFVSPEKRTQVLYSIVDKYRGVINKKYGEGVLIAVDFPSDFLTSYDYIDIVTALQARIDTAGKFLDAKIKGAGLYRSKKTGRSFVDIKEDIDLINNNDVRKAKSTILTLNLSKNSGSLANQYRQKVKQLTLDMQKKEAEALVARSLLKDLAPPLSSSRTKSGTSAGAENIVIDSSFIEGILKNNYYKTLVETSLKAGTEAKELELDKKFWEKEIVELMKDGKTNKRRGVEKETLVATLITIQDRVTDLLSEVNLLNQEYLGTTMYGAVQIVGEPGYLKVRDVSFRRIIVIVGMTVLMASIFLAFFMEFIQKNKLKLTEKKQ